MTANVYGAVDKVSKAGDTMTGTLVLDGATPLQIPGGSASGDVLTSDSSGNASWHALPGPTGTAGGDLGGTYPNPTVTATHLAAPLPLTQGGTGASTASSALAALSGTPISAVRAITAATVTANAWDVLECNTTSNAIMVTLPAATAGTRVTVKKTDSSTNPVTVSGTVDGVTNPTLTYQYQSLELVADGTAWIRVTRPSIGTLVDYPATTDARYLTLSAYGNHFVPSDQGLIAWTMDPSTTSANGTQLSSGYIYMLQVVLRQPATISKIDAVIGLSGSGLTSGECLAGLYNASGTRVGATADQSSAWTTTGDKQMSLTSSYSAPAGKYYIALLVNGTTSPSFACGSTFGANFTPGNAGLSAGNYRWCRSASGQTSLPASVTLSGYTPDANNIYAAVL